MTPPLRYLKLNIAAYGWLLALTTLLSLVVVAHHPLADLHDPALHLSDIAATGNAQRSIRGVVILIVLLLTTGVSGFAWRLGIAHPLVMAGWLSQVLGAAALIGALTIDGFVVPDLAVRNGAGALELIAFCGLGLNAGLRLGLVLTALSAVFFGHALLHHKGGALWIGLLGLGAGGFSAVFVMTAASPAAPLGLLAYMLAQAAWHLTMAFWMIRGLKTPPIAPA